MKLFVISFIVLLGIVYAQNCQTVSIPNIMQHLTNLNQIANDNNGNRAAGTDGYQASIEYIKSRLALTNFKVTVQDFPLSSWKLIDTPVFFQVEPERNSFRYLTDFRVFSGSASLMVSQYATAVKNSGCSLADYDGFPAGHIAIVQRGTCTFNEKAQLAESKSASALIIYNTDSGPAFNGNIVSKLAVLSIPHWLGIALTAEGKTVRLNIDVKSVTETVITSNILAETLTGDENSVVLLGSHLDSVPAGAGINDNGSGSSTTLEIALTAHRCLNSKSKLRFAWWAAEELGLLGSRHYVDDLVKNNPQELAKIAYVINIDMIGSPNFFYGIYNGSGAAPQIREKCVFVQRVFEQFLTNRGAPFDLTPFNGRSDYGPFIEVGIPAGGLFSGAEGIKTVEERDKYGGLANTAYDPCYHDSCDSLANISEEAITMLAPSAYDCLMKLSAATYQSNYTAVAPPKGHYYQYPQHPDALSIY